MKTKHLLFLSVLVFFMSCSGGKEKNEESDTAEPVPEGNVIDITSYSGILKGWVDFYAASTLSLDSFVLIKTDTLPNISGRIDNLDMEDDIFRPFYKYAGDSSKILDLYSYKFILDRNEDGTTVCSGSEIDTEVSIKDLKRKTWQRILFVGPSDIIEDGFWIDNLKLILVGQVHADPQYARPLIYFIDLKSNAVALFEYKHLVALHGNDYLREVILKDVEMAE